VLSYETDVLWWEGNLSFEGVVAIVYFGCLHVTSFWRRVWIRVLYLLVLGVCVCVGCWVGGEWRVFFGQVMCFGCRLYWLMFLLVTFGCRFSLLVESCWCC